TDLLVREIGNRRWCRSALGFCFMISAAVSMALSIFVDSPWVAAACTTWACFAIHFQLISWWGAVTEISGKHLGALFGLMNSLGVPGAVASQLFLGWFVDWLGGMGYTGRNQWDPAFFVYSALLMVGAVCWLFIDVTKSAVEPRDEDLE